MNYIENTENDKDVWVEIIKQYLEREETIQNILRVTIHPSTEIITTKTPYTIGKVRVGIIAQIKNPDTNGTEEIIIDIRHGGPSYQQLLDLIFGIGVDCKNRILIFDNEIEEDNALNNDRKVMPSIDFLNEHNSNTYLVQIERSFIIEISELKLLKKPPQKPKHYDSPLIEQIKLKKRRIDIFDFMSFYPGGNFDFFERTENISLNIARFNQSDVLEINCIWNDKGVVFQAMELTSIKALKMTWSSYGLNDKITTMNRSNYGPGELKIIYDERPVKNFIDLSQKEKDKFKILVALDFYIFLTSVKSDLEGVDFFELYENDTLLDYRDSLSDFNEARNISRSYRFEISKEWGECGAFINVVLDTYYEYDMFSYDEIVEKHPKKYDRDDMLHEFCSELENRIPNYSIDDLPYHPDRTGISIKVFEIPFSKIPLDNDAAKSLLDLLYNHQMAFADLLEDICIGKDRNAWKRFDFIDRSPLITKP